MKVFINKSLVFFLEKYKNLKAVKKNTTGCIKLNILLKVLEEKMFKKVRK
jgi:hypothetical protein